jgi:hypothetical protein
MKKSGVLFGYQDPESLTICGNRFWKLHRNCWNASTTPKDNLCFRAGKIVEFFISRMKHDDYTVGWLRTADRDGIRCCVTVARMAPFALNPALSTLDVGTEFYDREPPSVESKLLRRPS